MLPVALPANPAEAASVLTWYDANRAYLYFHPVAREFFLDVDAQSAGVASSTYRQSNPWPAGAGPNRVGVGNVPVR